MAVHTREFVEKVLAARPDDPDKQAWAAAQMREIEAHEAEQAEAARNTARRLAATSGSSMAEIEPLIERLERGLDTVERGGDTDADALTAEEWDLIHAAERGALEPQRALTPDEMNQAAARSHMFEREIGGVKVGDNIVGGMTVAEMRTRIDQAKAANDKVTLYLFATFAPDPFVRQLAKTPDRNTAVLEQTGRVSELMAAIRDRRAVPVEQRVALAFMAGKQPVNPNTRNQQGVKAAKDEQIAAMRAEAEYHGLML